MKIKEQLLFKLITKEKLSKSDNVNEFCDPDPNAYSELTELTDIAIVNLQWFLKDANYFLDYLLNKLLVEKAENIDDYAVATRILMNIAYNILKTEWKDEYKRIRVSRN
jgi:hypothetical protein